MVQRIESRFKTGSKIHWRQIILFIEIVMLLAVGFMPSGLSMLANIMVSFIFIFAIGAGIDGILSSRFGTGTIWISPAILLVVALMMVRE